MMNCGYKGGDIDTINGISSLMRCAEACFNSSDCNFFTFNNVVTSSSICSLKTVSDNSQIVSTQGGICGIIEKRIPKLRSKRSLSASDVSSHYGRQFQSSGDGSYFLASSCSFSGSNTQFYDDPSVSSVDGCARKCKAESYRCDQFTYLIQPKYVNREETGYGCVLYKGGVHTQDSSGNFCGVIQSIPPTQPPPRPQPPPQPQPLTPAKVNILSSTDVSTRFGRQFQTSSDGTYVFAISCNFPGDNTKIYQDSNAESVDSCAKACEVHPDICDHFVIVIGSTCYLKKNPSKSYTENHLNSLNWICGVMTNLPRSQSTTTQSPPIPLIPNFNNVEFMPSKCKNDELTTTTIQPDATPSDSFHSYDILE